VSFSATCEARTLHLVGVCGTAEAVPFQSTRALSRLGLDWVWLAGGGSGGVGQLGNMHTGLGFGDGAVVDLNLCWLALDQDMLVGGAAGGDQDSLGDGVGGGADGYGNFSRSVAVVGDVYGHEPVVGLGGDGEDAGDGEVGKAFVGVDPVGEEPRQILTGAGLPPQRRRPVAGGPALLVASTLAPWFRVTEFPKMH
jgi:hypothetical protein